MPKGLSALQVGALKRGEVRFESLDLFEKNLTITGEIKVNLSEWIRNLSINRVPAEISFIQIVATIQKVVKLFPKMVEFWIDGLDSFKGDELLPLSQVTKLRRLVAPYTRITDHHLSTITANNPHLKELCLANTNISDLHTLVNQGITHLFIDKCNIVYQGEPIFGTQLTHLTMQIFNLRSEAMPNAFLNAVIEKNQLQLLYMVGWSAPIGNDHGVTKLTTLRYFNGSYSVFAAKTIEKVILNNPEIMVLNLEGYYNHNHLEETDLAAISQLRKLVDLNLENQHFLTSDILQNILTNNPNLKHLNINHCAHLVNGWARPPLSYESDPESEKSYEELSHYCDFFKSVVKQNPKIKIHWT